MGRRSWSLVLGVIAIVGATQPGRAAGDDGVLDRFFAIWDRDDQVTPGAVRSLYASRVDYYGQVLTAEGVYANKRQFIQRWPDRRYVLVPGTVAKNCDRDQTRCTVSGVLSYHAQNPARGTSARGYTRVSLSLERQDGDLRIVRENGRRVDQPSP